METHYGAALSGGVWELADEEAPAVPKTRSEAIREACEDREPEVRLLAELIALAVEDLEVIEATRGVAVEVSDVLRLNAVSSATFFIKGMAGAYMKLIGIESALPMLQQRSIRVLGALGPGWSYLSKLKGDKANQRIAEALDIARRPLERMRAPASARAGMTARMVASLI